MYLNRVIAINRNPILKINIVFNKIFGTCFPIHAPTNAPHSFELTKIIKINHLKDKCLAVIASC